MKKATATTLAAIRDAFDRDDWGPTCFVSMSMRFGIPQGCSMAANLPPPGASGKL
jgi:hypothetical protein